MDVIGHQAIGPDLDLRLAAGLRQQPTRGVLLVCGKHTNQLGIVSPEFRRLAVLAGHGALDRLKIGDVHFH